MFDGKKDDTKEPSEDDKDKKPPFVDRVLQKAVDHLKGEIEKKAAAAAGCRRKGATPEGSTTEHTEKKKNFFFSVCSVVIGISVERPRDS